MVSLNNVKLALFETIILPYIRPDLFEDVKKSTQGLLLFGPPGNEDDDRQVRGRGGAHHAHDVQHGALLRRDGLSAARARRCQRGRVVATHQDGVPVRRRQVGGAGGLDQPDQLQLDAVLRRFPKRIMVPNPDAEERYSVVLLLTSKKKHALNEQAFRALAAATENYSWSDLAILCGDAAMARCAA